VRQRALFWVAMRAESQAIAAITDAIDRDSDLEVKKQAVFALSRLPSDQGIPLLIMLARSSSNPTVRKQAMFWLGQSRDPRAIAFFEEILR
jgi:HEAT repeat protein